MRQWLTATHKTDIVNKIQIKISLSLYLFQITFWIGWTVVRMTFTLSQSLKSSGRISTLADTDADRVIGQNDPLQLTSWPLTPQWPCDKNYQHDVQQTSCLKKIKHTLIIPDHTRQPQITLALLTRLPKECISWICKNLNWSICIAQNIMALTWSINTEVNSFILVSLVYFRGKASGKILFWI